MLIEENVSELFSGKSNLSTGERENAQRELSSDRQQFFGRQRGFAEKLLNEIDRGFDGSAIRMLRQRDMEVCLWEIPIIQEELEDVLGYNDKP